MKVRLGEYTVLGYLCGRFGRAGPAIHQQSFTTCSMINVNSIIAIYECKAIQVVERGRGRADSRILLQDYLLQIKEFAFPYQD